MNATQVTISEDDLRSAHPRLIARAKLSGPMSCNLSCEISDVDPSWDEVIDEGYDPNVSPMAPVYWRIVRRGDAEFYLSTFQITRDEVIRGWGQEGISYCDPITGTAVVQIETHLATMH